MDAFTACPRCGTVGPSREQCQCGYPASGPGWGERMGRRLTRIVSGRVRIIAIAAGAAFSWYGIQEFQLGMSSTPEPAEVDLAKLETGEPAPQNHLRLGPHLALYNGAVYSISDSNKDLPNPPVKYTIYAIVSESHPYGKMVKQLLAPPADAKEPGVLEAPALELDRVAVLVKTNTFASAGMIPNQPVAQPSVQGLAINQIQSLSDQEANLVRQVVPGIDLEKVILLEEGRRPKSHLQSLGIAAAGACFLVLGLWSFVMERSYAKRDAATAIAKAPPVSSPANSE